MDHIAILVKDTDQALLYFGGKLGLAVVSTEELSEPPVRLTYLDAGNAYIQLVEPRDPSSPIGTILAERGEGLHHICFGVEDVPSAATMVSSPGSSIRLGSGRSRISAFAADSTPHGVLVEFTEFIHKDDVDANPGWIAQRHE